jgi:phosphohistidine phosphatase
MNVLRVVLFRHGPAGKRDPKRWPDDGKRPLSPRGKERTLAAAAGVARLSGVARAIWTSPLVRADQTAELLGRRIEAAAIERVEALKPNGSWRELIERLQQSQDAGGTVVLVGHEPDLGKLAGSLVFGAPRALPLKKAGALAIQFDGPVAAGKGEILWLASPRMLRTLGRKRSKVT